MTSEDQHIVEEIANKAVDKLRHDMSNNYLSKADAQRDFVTWKTFTWVISLLMTVTLGVLSAIYLKLDNMDEQVSSIREDVSGLTTISEFIKQLQIETK